MQRLIKNLCLASTILFVTACVHLPSQPLSFDQLGRYKTIPLNQNTYRISFMAPQHYSFGQAEEIALIKSAQMTVQKDFELFKVLQDPSNRLTQQPPRQTVVYPVRPLHHMGYYRESYFPDPYFDAPYMVNIDPIEVSYTIQMFKKNMAPADAFDAKIILETIGASYGVNVDGSLKTVTPPPKAK